MKKIFLLGIVLLAITACNKIKLSKPDDFNVSVNGTKFTTKDTVLFTFDGNPNQITWYSGEATHVYDNRNRTSARQDSTLLTFSTTTTAPSATTQPINLNNVSVLFSTDYNGKLDPASIKAATWTDLSAKAKFATTTVTVASGNIHLEALQAGASNSYVAFKYISDTSTTNSQARRWIVNAVSVKSFFKDTTNIVAKDFQTGGFNNIYSILNPTNTWVYANASLTFNAPLVASSKDEDWAISRPMNLNTIQSDFGVVLKNASVRLPLYKYVFKKPGTYVATFLGQNVTSDGALQVVKQFTITVN